ncbi:MAG: hypothetical protein ACK559_37045, partial [bacterium]
PCSWCSNAGSSCPCPRARSRPCSVSERKAPPSDGPVTYPAGRLLFDAVTRRHWVAALIPRLHQRAQA